ncbi:MAG: hypothetical protein Hyperionvirus29_33 [Hyperionvirus sp.]|uniref:Uncharacterized protein n=1 Tax=Hyperionvirus sp. TaxID=2487770 RepID=A0A3G5ABK9_9VIRU|nr:MAG: hypothetical protein Hyperionvirus29_33 [Hyperionvirus sp.]
MKKLSLEINGLLTLNKELQSIKNERDLLKTTFDIFASLTNKIK